MWRSRKAAGWTSAAATTIIMNRWWCSLCPRRFVVKKKFWMLVLLTAGITLAQTPEVTAIKSAADALGGVDRVRAVKTLIMEGEGTNPNVGQNVTPDAPL